MGIYHCRLLFVAFTVFNIILKGAEGIISVWQCVAVHMLEAEIAKQILSLLSALKLQLWKEFSKEIRGGKVLLFTAGVRICSQVTVISDFTHTHTNYGTKHVRDAVLRWFFSRMIMANPTSSAAAQFVIATEDDKGLFSCLKSGALTTDFIMGLWTKTHGNGRKTLEH